MVNVVDLIVSRSGRVIKLPRLDLRMTPDTYFVDWLTIKSPPQ
jgi:hypothetical protein